MCDNSNSSLFAGMKFGSDKTDVESTSKDIKTQLPEKQSVASDPIMDEPGRATPHSNFSFIRQTETVQPTIESDLKEMENQVSGSKTSLLDLFQTLDEDVAEWDNDNLLSYSHQLTEILPMTTRDEDASITPLPDEPQELEDLNTVRKETQLCHIILENKQSVLSVKDIEETNEKYNIHLEAEDNLTLFYSQHSFKLTELRNEKDQLKSNLCLAYEDVKNKLVSLEENLVSLRLELDEVLCNDDYDLAAEINDKIEQLIIEKNEFQNTREELLNDKVKQYFTDVATFKEKETKFHDWSLCKYDELEKQLTDLLTEYKSKSTVEIDTKRQELKFEKDELNRSVKHIQLDKDYVSEDQTELDRKIEARLQIFQNKKTELIGKHECLAQEIDILEKKLQNLKNEKNEIEYEIKGEENKMKEVRKEFESLETRLRAKNDEIQHQENMFRDKLEKVVLQEKYLEDVCLQNRDKEEILLKNIIYITTNKRESESMVGKCQESLDVKIMEIFTKKVSGEQSERLKKLQTLEKEKTTKLENLELLVFTKEQVIMTKTKRLCEIGNQIPEYEKSKKLAVTEHNFKEAKRLNDIVKQLSSEVETSKEELLDMENRLKDERDEVKSLKDEFEILKKETLSATERHNNEIFLRIVYKIMDLIGEKDRITPDDILDDLIKSELDLLKTEFSFLGIPSENLVSKMNNVDQENIIFVKEFLKHEKEMKASSTGPVQQDVALST